MTDPAVNTGNIAASKRVAVGSITDGRGGDQAGAADALGIHDGAVGPQRGERALHGPLAQPAGRIDALAEAGDRHFPGAHVTSGPDHEQPRGIRAAVDRSERTGVCHADEYHRACAVRSPTA